MFVSPIVAATGTIAAPDVMIAAIAYALFIAIEYGRRQRLLCFFAWTFAPWVEREFARPALDVNAWFARLPLDLTVHGERTNGLLGPVFLLLPLALLSARHAQSRRWLLAGLLLALPSLGATEARAFIPALPFFRAGAGGGAEEHSSRAPGGAHRARHHELAGFRELYARGPAMLYSPGALHQTLGAARRIEPEDAYLHRRMDAYAVGRLLETTVPDGDRILSLAPFQTIYHSRAIVDDARLRDYVDQPTLEGVRRAREAGIRWLIVPPRHPAAETLLDNAAAWQLELRLFEREYAVFRLPELH